MTRLALFFGMATAALSLWQGHGLWGAATRGVLAGAAVYLLLLVATVAIAYIAGSAALRRKEGK